MHNHQCATALALLVAACGRVSFDPDAASDALDSQLDGSIDTRVDAPVDAPAPQVANRLFLSANMYNGALGGLAGADAKCQAEATSAGLDGTFVAVISLGNASGASRLNGARGWQLVDGTPVADLATDFTSGNLRSPVNGDSLGGRIGSFELFRLGVLGDCDGWTSITPMTDYATSDTPALFSAGNAGCATASRLLCAGTSRNAPLELPAVDARKIVFTSRTRFRYSRGRDNADAICNSEGSLIWPTRTFKALLPIGSQTSISRFGPGPYQRSDGIAIGPFDAPLTWLNRDARGNLVTDIPITGASPSEIRSAAELCDDWQSTGSSVQFGRSYSLRTVYDAGMTPCSSEGSIYCVEP